MWSREHMMDDLDCKVKSDELRDEIYHKWLYIQAVLRYAVVRSYNGSTGRSKCHKERALPHVLLPLCRVGSESKSLWV